MEEQGPKMIVIDCSVLVAGILPDEAQVLAQRLLGELQQGLLYAVVPPLFYTEVSNVLLMAYRRNRMSRDVWQEYLDTIAMLPITVDTTTAIKADSIKTVSALADKHQLTSYDAVYLELAVRRNFQLATFDEDLYHAAVQEGIGYSRLWPV